MRNVCWGQKILIIIAMAGSVGCSVTTSDTLKPAEASLGYDLNSPNCTDLPAVPTTLYCQYVSGIANPKLLGSGTSASPYKICSPYQFNNIGGDITLLASYFEITRDLDMSCISGNHAIIGTTAALSFTGSIKGNNKKIIGWTNSSPTTDYVGVIGFSRGGHVADLQIQNANITGQNWVGLLGGDFEGGSIVNVTTSGTVTGISNVGGIVGRTELGAITQSRSSGSINGTSNVGGIVGAGGTTHLNSCFFAGTVSAAGDRAGGIVGSSFSGYILNSYSTGSVTSTANRVGGILGGGGAQIRNCYSSGPINGGTHVGGLVGEYTGASTLINSFTTSAVSGDSSSANVGAVEGSNMGVKTNVFYWSGASCDANKTTVGVQACNANSVTGRATLSDFYSIASEPLASWDFQGESVMGRNDLWAIQTSGLPVPWYIDPASYTVPFSGAGTLADPYLINNVADWNLIGSNPRWMGANFKLTANLDFLAQTFTQVGGWRAPFYGTFDGNSKALQNITYNDLSTPFGATFGVFLHPGKIHHLTITNASITGPIFDGILAGVGTGEISHVNVSGSLSGGYHSGGLVGSSYSPSVISNCSANITFTVPVAFNGNAGGLVGSFNYSTLQDSYATGTITGSYTYTGGIAGGMHGGTIKNSYSTISIPGGNSAYAGGVVGRALYESTIENSYATGNITGRNNTGGFLGYGSATVVVRNSFSTGNVNGTGTSTKVGTFIGEFVGTSTNNYYSSGVVCDSALAGGIQACNTSFATSRVLADFYSSALEPMASWDFTAKWVANILAYPTLQ
ncbi:MAG: GLUG motif-containing protein [Bdellovibrionota bacterium]